MGTGKHGGFGRTAGSMAASDDTHFTLIRFKGTVIVDGELRDVSRRVYQRGDIDFDYKDLVTGKTNIQLMESGKAPIGSDGKPIQLHHILQKESGPMVEIKETTHSEYHRILHGLIDDGGSFRHDELLSKQYKNFRKKYWRWRAQQYKKGL